MSVPVLGIDPYRLFCLSGNVFNFQTLVSSIARYDFNLETTSGVYLLGWGGGGGGSDIKGRGSSLKILKTNLKRNQDPVLWLWHKFLFPARGSNSLLQHISSCHIFLQLNTLLAPTADHLGLNTL